MQAKHWLIVLSLALGLALLVWSLLALTSQPGQAAPVCDRYVVNGGNNSSTNHCDNPNDPCKSVQYALSRASAGERICVADRDDIAGASTYYGTIIITRSVTLDGAWAAHPNPFGGGWTFTSVPCAPENVVLSGDGTQRVISITHASPTIFCFTITNGNAGGATDQPNHGGGIAVQDAAPIILSNIITANYGCTTMACTGYGRGGGIFLDTVSASAVISDNLIANNVADDATWGQGGGIYLVNASPQVLSNTIRANRAGHSAGDGGGIAVVGGSPLIADNDFLQNVAGQGVMGNGGGIYVSSGSPVTIERNLFDGNIALQGTASAGLYNRGGGICFGGPLALIRDNRVYGNTATTGPRGLGGGMYLSHLSAAALVAGNVISDGNRASYAANGYGGGLYLEECDATVVENQIVRNTASSGAPAEGGGIYVSGGSGVLRDNVIAENDTVVWAPGEWAYGGGMALHNSNALVQDNLIARNEAACGTNARGVGGGVYVWAGAPRFVGNQVLSNTTGDGGAEWGYGGGFSIGGSNPWLEGNIILDNRAIGTSGGVGGGVDLTASDIFTLTNNIVARNGITTTAATSAQGSGVAIAGSGGVNGRVAHNTIAENRFGDGVGVYVGASSTVWLTNTIIVSQTTGIVNASPGGSTVTADHTLFEGNGANYGVGVTSTNEVPGPAGLAADYHLTLGSNAINHATPLVWVAWDMDGDPRPMGAAPDVGADELPYLYLPLVLRNG